MGKPRMLILIRHAQSEGNKNREIHQTVPDHRVKLTAEGHRQAHEAGNRLRELLRPDDTIHFFTSPYRRTRETTEGILNSLTSDHSSPSPFPRHTIKVYEEPRLREQDFGNFQPCSAEMERMWHERADYGHFFYRIPNGESAADAYDRVSGFNETLWRLFGEDDFASVCVLVTHGLMTRVFLMKWYHWSVEYFEDLRNINHCEFVIMKLNPDNGKYVLQNKLRTWSELRREKELERQREGAAKSLGPAPLTPSDSPIPLRRKWGGCPDGCNHGRPKAATARTVGVNTAESLPNNTQNSKKQPAASSNDEALLQDESGHEPASTASTEHKATTHEAVPNDRRSAGAAGPRLIDGIISSPDDTPSYISLGDLAQPRVQPTPFVLSSDNDKRMPSESEPTTIRPAVAPKPRPKLSHLRRDTEDDFLHPPVNVALLHLGGRDGGGSMSGANSLAPSDEETDGPMSVANPPRNPPQDLEDDGDDEGSGKQRSRRPRLHLHHHPRHGGKRMANVLGDGDDSDHPASTADEAIRENAERSQGQEEEEEDKDRECLEEQRRRDQSIRGSVY